MWNEYNAETCYPIKDGVVMFEIQAIENPKITLVLPFHFQAHGKRVGKHIIDPLLDGPGGLDYDKFKPTHFFTIPKREL